MTNYLRHFKIFYSDKVNRILVLTIIFLIIGFSFFKLFVVNRTESVFVDQVFLKEKIAVSSGANSIKVFLKMAENSLLLLSRNSSIINQDEDIQGVLDQFASDWINSPLIGVGRLSKDGEVSFMDYSIGGSYKMVEGFTATSRDYFNWAKAAYPGDTYLGKPLIPKTEKDELGYIIPYVAPIFKDGEFDGVLVLGISLSRLIETYIDPLKISPNPRVYLIHTDGTILATLTEDKEYLGLNYFKYLQDNPYSGSDKALQGLKTAVDNKIGGKLDIFLYSLIENDITRFIIAYDPIIYNNKHWTLGVAVPIKDTLESFNPIRQSSILMFVLFIIVILIMSAIALLLVRISQIKAYLHGLKDGKKGRKK